MRRNMIDFIANSVVSENKRREQEKKFQERQEAYKECVRDK